MVPSFHKKFKNYLSDLKKVVLHERFGTSLNHNQQAKDHKQQFMVPSFANNPKKRPGPWVKAFESLRESVWDIWESVQRPNKDNALNRWLRAAR
jgi:hypothetical protein